MRPSTLLHIIALVFGFRAVVGLRAIILPILGSLRGSIADVVFSHNKGGDYIRLRTTPTNPNSSRQQSTRNHLATCAAWWSTTLTGVKRSQWVNYAMNNTWLNALGQSIYLTGLDWFCMLNSRRLDAGLAISDTPTDPSAPVGHVTMSIVVATGSTLEVTFTDALPADGMIQLWVSPPLRVGQNPNFRQCKLVGYSPQDQASPWTATMAQWLDPAQSVKVYSGVMSQYGRVSTFLDARATWTP